MVLLTGSSEPNTSQCRAAVRSAVPVSADDIAIISRQKHAVYKTVSNLRIIKNCLRFTAENIAAIIRLQYYNNKKQNASPKLKKLQKNFTEFSKRLKAAPRTRMKPRVRGVEIIQERRWRA